MRRGGALRLGPAALVPALALVMAVAAAGCGGSGGSGDPVGASAGAVHGAPSSPTTTPGPQRPLSGAELCVSAVGYWAHEMLDGREPYGDYQSMGLSNRQYDILRQVVAAARAARRTQGVRAAGELSGRQTRATCAEEYRDGGPSHGPWRS